MDEIDASSRDLKFTILLMRYGTKNPTASSLKHFYLISIASATKYSLHLVQVVIAKSLSSKLSKDASDVIESCRLIKEVSFVHKVLAQARMNFSLRLANGPS